MSAPIRSTSPTTRFAAQRPPSTAGAMPSISTRGTRAAGSAAGLSPGATTLGRVLMAGFTVLRTAAGLKARLCYPAPPEGATMAEPSPSTTLSMPIEEAMRTQRAIRRLKPDPVDDALVLHLIELALRAPTGSNAQNWQFVVVKDRAVKARLGKLNRQAWRLYGGIGRRMAKNDRP
jgi:hypothetical protein